MMSRCSMPCLMPAPTSKRGAPSSAGARRWPTRSLSANGGRHRKGELIAELDIRDDLWFFDCHFIGDPVMPGCLGLDAMWQLVGFFLGWSGAPGRGRALGVGEVKYSGQVTPKVRKVVYRIELKKVILRRLVLGVGDGVLEADGNPIYEARDLRVGLFNAADLV